MEEPTNAAKTMQVKKKGRIKGKGRKVKCYENVAVWGRLTRGENFIIHPLSIIRADCYNLAPIQS